MEEITRLHILFDDGKDTLLHEYYGTSLPSYYAAGISDAYIQAMRAMAQCAGLTAIRTEHFDGLMIEEDWRDWNKKVQY